MINQLKSFVRNRLRRKEFTQICATCGLKLDWASNAGDLATIKEIFVQRSYADYFPFKQKAVVVDIGSHKGYFTLFAAKNTASQSSFFCLEPAKENLAVLKKNLDDNGVQNYHVLPYAIYSRKETLKFYPSKSVNYSIFAGGNSGQDGAVEVPAVSLKDLFEEQHIDHVDFLKMDCEGGEYPALLQADPAALSKISVISMEFHDIKDSEYTAQHLAAHLEKNNFEIMRFEHKPTVYDLNYGMLIARNKAGR